MIDLADVFSKLMDLAVAGAVEELKQYIEGMETPPIAPGFWSSPLGRFYLRAAATKATIAENMATVSYFCGERGVPANYVPPDEKIIAGPSNRDHTPFWAAIAKGDEDMALHLLSLALHTGQDLLG